jgi:hypothetical protein
MQSIMNVTTRPVKKRRSLTEQELHSVVRGAMQLNFVPLFFGET